MCVFFSFSCGEQFSLTFVLLNFTFKFYSFSLWLDEITNVVILVANLGLFVTEKCCHWWKKKTIQMNQIGCLPINDASDALHPLKQFILLGSRRFVAAVHSNFFRINLVLFGMVPFISE